MNPLMRSRWLVIALFCSATALAAITARLAPAVGWSPLRMIEHPTVVQPTSFQAPTPTPSPTSDALPLASTVVPSPTSDPTITVPPTRESLTSPTVNSDPLSRGFRARVVITAGMRVRTRPLGDGIHTTLANGAEVIVTGWTIAGGQRWFQVRVGPRYDQDYWMASEAERGDRPGMDITLVPVEGEGIDLFDVRLFIPPPD